MEFKGIDFTVFSYAPVFPVLESLSTLTDIITPNNGIGSEQRISIRSIPRQSFKYDYYLKTEKEQAIFEAILFGWAKKTFGLPVWTEKVLHTADIKADDETITVDTTNADFRDDSLAIIWSSADNYEVIQIDTIIDTTLILAQPVEKSFTGNKWLMPLRLAQITSSVQGQHPDVADIRQITINFAIRDNIQLEGFLADSTYNDSTVLNIPHKFDAGSHKQIIIDPDFQMQDYGSGDFVHYSDSEFNRITHNFGFVKDTKAAIWNLRLFIHSLKGRQGSCWVPTYRADLKQKETIGSTDTAFNIENIGLAENMGVNSLRKNLAFIFPDGSQLYREITDISEIDENTEQITIDSALDITVEPGDCYISFLDKCRLLSDIIEIEHLHTGKAKCILDFINLSCDAYDTHFDFEYIRRDGTNTYTATGAGFKDEDDLASDSSVATASQRSIKAYIDAFFSYILGAPKGSLIYIWPDGGQKRFERLEPNVGDILLRCGGADEPPLWM